MTDEKTVDTTEAPAVEATEAPAVEAPAVEAPVEKKVTYRIEVDENGKELSRKIAGRGRPPRNSSRDADGNLVVVISAETEVKVKAESITVDGEGNVLERKPKGRGRPAEGFEKQTEGEYAGHYLKVQIPEVVATEAPEVDASQAVEAPAEATA